MTELLKHLFKVKSNTYGLSLKLICVKSLQMQKSKSTAVLCYHRLNALVLMIQQLLLSGNMLQG